MGRYKSKKHTRLLRSRTPAASLAAIFLVTAAVGVGLLLRPASHAATTLAEVRMECGVDHYAPDDPIVFPGQPGVSHMHSFYGNTTTNAASTNASINGSNSSCAYIGAFDRSAYWVPSLYTLNADGTSTMFSNSSQEMIVYYRRAGNAAGPKVQPFPVGLRMIAGDAHATSPQPLSVTFWDCNGGPQYTSIPNCAGQSSGTTPRAVLNFPNCWDGVHLDSADHKSHMAYANPTTFVCPADHPVAVPAISYEYSANGTTGGPSMFLSSGGVYSWHGDFVAAWDARLQLGLIQYCMNDAIVECHVIQVAQNGDVSHNGTFLFNLNSIVVTPTPTPSPTPTGTPTPTPTPTPTGTPAAPPGDINGDGKVNVLDLSSLLSKWGTNTAADDLNHDGIVNITDLSVLLSHWTG